MRFLLGVALVVSLWPAGVTVAIGMNWNDDPRARTSSSGASEDPPAVQPSEPGEGAGEGAANDGRSALRPIVASVRRLNDDFQTAELAVGEPNQELGSEAEGLVEELRSWEASYGAAASENELTAVSLLTVLAQSMDRLASAPTEETLNTYREAIDDFNQFVESVSSG